ncbi:glycosyltransferase [Paramixta manurensis]|uniref:Glycosyltransferase n=1 Tax=Paramixta manurensis TaxID=2740817 RepID=A0A6M8UAS9_9GAMM|nr:glycosyltransferase [Erwiniaceae bacterium PD-1]
MKFTVLLSLYYKESTQHLSECLDSIVKNSFQPDQVVIVFDGPVGEELEAVVTTFSSQLPIERVRLPANVGLGSALNHGLAITRNEIVFRMDTDDICLPARFEEQITLMRNYPEVSLLGSAAEEFDESMHHSQGVRFSSENHADIVQYARKRNPFNHMSVVFKKSAIDKVGGYQHHLYMEDYNLWLRLIAQGYITHNLPDVLLHVRAGNNMIGRRKGRHYIASEIKLAKLKYHLKLDSLPGVIGCALIRILPRLLPVFLLKAVYKTLRK